MKKGDTYPVTIAGQVVAQATIQSIESDRATLVIPGTVVVMAIRTDFATEEPTQPQTEGTEVIIDGIQGPNGPVVQEAPVAEEVAPKDDSNGDTMQAEGSPVATAPVETAPIVAGSEAPEPEKAETNE